MAEAADKPADPKAAALKYTYPDAAKDSATVTKVETAITQHFPLSYTVGLLESAHQKHVDQREIEARKKDAEDQAAKEKKDHPDEVAKEAKDSPPPPLAGGAAVKPAIKEAHVSTAGAKEPAKGAAGAPPKPHAHASAHEAKGHSEAMPTPSKELVLTAAAGDGTLDQILNTYPHKSPETSEKLSKIKEMAAIAKGFDGQVEGYVKNGDGPMESAKAGMIGFLGKKEMSAAFGENPYSKVQGGLALVMNGISRFQNVVSVVGNVCTKLGMVLTVVGLLGLIFPPLGAAVSAVARVLNVIGIICEAIGFALSGILTGLNGVALAQQIAKGASNEEKAATADMMVTEATSASGHVMSLAMSYGPGFMKGFKFASKGVIKQLFAKLKNAIGKFATKALGPVANWAKNIGYKVGIGLGAEAKSEGPGLLARAWKSPATALEKVRGTSLVSKINNSGVMQGLERKSTALNKVGWINGVADAGENAGKAVGAYGRTGGLAGTTESIRLSAVANETAANQAAEEAAAKDAGNRERAKIEREISSKRDLGNTEYEKSVSGGHGAEEVAAARSTRLYGEADDLAAGEKGAVSKAEVEGKEDASTRIEGKRAKKDAAEKAEVDEKATIKQFNKDPQKFQEETTAIEAERKAASNRLKDPSVPAEERERLEKEAEKLAREADERHMISLKAGGGEAPESLRQAKNTAKEWMAASHGVDEKGEKLESYAKHVEKASGHEGTEKGERAERHETLEPWEHHEVPVPTTSEQVEGMLAGVDEEPGAEPGAHEGADAPQVANDNSHAVAAPAEPGENHVAAAAAVPVAPAAAAEPAKEPAAEVPELVYWPNLAGANGDFAKAAKDLQHMKLVAYAFHKSQLEAKSKAMETVTLLSKSSEDAAKKQDQAQQHASALHPSVDEAKTAGASADKGTAQAQEGGKKQNEGQANGPGSPQQAPDPGEKPSRWHPIKRIWWSLKKWAADTSATAFGWIQTQIASMVLRGLCGVSMADMSAYTTALHNRMAFSKAAGTKGIDETHQAKDESAKTESKSKTYAEQAMEDARECDQNISDADAFVKDVEATEREVAAEQARAAQFLSDLKAAVAAERARQAEYKAKKAQEAARLALGAGADPGAAGASAAVAQPAPVAPPGRKTAAESKQVPAASIGKLTGAAGYVVTQAHLIVQQLTSSKTEQTSRFKAILEKQPKSKREAFEKLSVGDGVVSTMRAHVTSVIDAMGHVRSATPTSSAALHAAVGQVKSRAKDLDEVATSAFQALNASFRATYDAVGHMKSAG